MTETDATVTPEKNQPIDLAKEYSIKLSVMAKLSPKMVTLFKYVLTAGV